MLVESPEEEKFVTHPYRLELLTVPFRASPLYLSPTATVSTVWNVMRSLPYDWEKHEMCPQRSDALIKDQATVPHSKSITSSTLDTFTWILKVTSSSICLTQNLPILVSHPPITTCVHLGPPSVLISMPGTSINPRYQHRYFPVSHHPEPIHHQVLLILLPSHPSNLSKSLHLHYHHTVQAIIISCLDL